MKLEQSSNKYILTDKEKRALIWSIEHYKQQSLNYLPLNYQMSQEMKGILKFVEKIANSARELQQCMTIAAIQKASEIEEKTIVKIQKQEKKKHAKGGEAKGVKK